MRKDAIFVTGATGFVGLGVVEQLLAAGRRVVAAVRDPARCPPSWHGRENLAILATGELTPESDLAPALEDVAAVVHLAGLAHVTLRGPEAEAAFMRANAGATKALAKSAAAAGVEAFIHMSSLAAVVPNAFDRIIDDETDLGPATPYGRSKRLAEEAVAELAGAGMLAVSLRPPLVVGAGARGNWAALQALAATGAPLPFASVDNRRSFVGIGALGEAVALLCSGNWPAALSGNYVISNRGVLSLPQVIRLLRKGMGLPARLFPFPPALLEAAGIVTGRRRQLAGLIGDLKVDPGRFFRTFSFETSISLEQEIVSSGAAYSAARRRPR